MQSAVKNLLWKNVASSRFLLSRVHFSNGQSAGPVYELRVYEIKPEKFKSYMDLMADKFHLRMVHSKPLGFWSSDLGGIFEVVHIWEYKSLSERARIRQTLATDEPWQKEFFSKFLTYTDKLQNSLMVLTPGTTLFTDFPPSTSAAYELLVLPDIQNTQLVKSADEIIVGQFSGIYGSLSTEYRLLRYPDVDTAFVHARKRKETGRWFGTSKLMFPVGCSPIK